MAILGAEACLLRNREDKEAGKVSFVELFFDLVFVFAVTQLSHTLLAHLTPMGAVQTGLLFMAIWWVWVYTSWATNWLDPQKVAVRLMLMAMMLAGLCLSTSLMDAFGEKAMIFAVAFVAMQVGRSLFVLWALARHDAGNFRNFQRITAWLTMSGAFWIAGAFVDPNWRLLVWGIALLIEIIGPAAGYATPFLGRSTTADWKIDGHHMAERCGLFIIIALGESVLVTGMTFAELKITVESVSGFAAAFVGSVAMWWIYFDITADTASERIAEADDPGRLARLAYTYLHLPLVAGIIVCAVADELVLEHPSGPVSLSTALVMIGGPALFVLGNTLFKRAMTGKWPNSHIIGLGLLVTCVVLVPYVTPLVLTFATTSVLVLVALIETIGLRHTSEPVA